MAFAWLLAGSAHAQTPDAPGEPDASTAQQPAVPTSAPAPTTGPVEAPEGDAATATSHASEAAVERSESQHHDQAPPPESGSHPGETAIEGQPEATEPIEPALLPADDLTLAVTEPALPSFQIHGFASEGGYVSTANEYIGSSERGSLKYLELGLNTTVILTDQLRFGVQLVTRHVGTLSEEVPRLDWGFGDFRWKRWLGIRAGVIKLPMGLYNESVAIDAARTAILPPQSLYPIRNRDALISQIGFSLYGNVPLGAAGAFDYQAWLGTLSIPRSALVLVGASLDSVDTQYVTGAQLFWRPPIDGLRLGGTYLRTVIDFNVTLDAGTTQQLIQAGLVPDDYAGDLLITQDPTSFWVASAEYALGDWLIAAEYGRFLKYQEASLPELIPTLDEEAERFYAMVNYRLSPLLEFGTYYSVVHADATDRLGRDDRFTPKSRAFQRDLAGTLRLDINEYWLWKLEAHFIDGVAELETAKNPDPKRFWGLFLFRTTVTF